MDPSLRHFVAAFVAGGRKLAQRADSLSSGLTACVWSADDRPGIGSSISEKTDEGWDDDRSETETKTHGNDGSDDRRNLGRTTGQPCEMTWTWRRTPWRCGTPCVSPSSASLRMAGDVGLAAAAGLSCIQAGVRGQEKPPLDLGGIEKCAAICSVSRPEATSWSSCGLSVNCG